MNPFSLNNKLVVETYKGGREIRKTVTNGFAMPSQKMNLVGLEVLMDAKMADGSVIPAGSKAYIREEILFSGAFAKKVLECDFMKEPFIVAERENFDFIVPPNGEAA